MTNIVPPASRDVNVEIEAVRLLALAGVELEELARFTRLEPSELIPLLAEPRTMRPVVRMQIATVLRRCSDKTPDWNWSALIADALWKSSIESFERAIDQLYRETLAPDPADPAEFERQFAQLLFNELGPEVFEHPGCGESE